MILEDLKAGFIWLFRMASRLVNRIKSSKENATPSEV
jgi:hypothetical protein